MTYSIWLTPAFSDAKYLNKIIKNLAKKYNSHEFSAHVTIFSGISSLSQAKSAVKQIHSGPIKANKVNIGQSDYLWKTLFVRVKKEKALDTVYKTLRSNLENNYAFKPHISLIYKKLDSVTKRKIKTSLKIKSTFVFDRITIIKSSKNVKTWKKLYSLRLDATRRA